MGYLNVKTSIIYFNNNIKNWIVKYCIRNG